MEKIMNMPVQASTSVPSTVPRQTQNSVQDTKDDFIRLLQQQKELTGQPEEKDVGKTKDVKDDGKQAEKPEEEVAVEPEEKTVEEPVEDTEVKEALSGLVQMELQQSILQQAVVQIVEPAAADRQVSMEAGVEVVDAVIPEAVQEVSEFSMEASVLPEQQFKVQPESVEPEVKTESVKAEKTDTAEAGPVKTEIPEHVAELPREEHQEASTTEQQFQSDQAAVPEKREPVHREAETVRDYMTNRDVNQTAPIQPADVPVRLERLQHVSQPNLQEGQHTVRTTVEELPQELGKAVTVGRPGDSQVLTVELEPASLGKLTIRLEYEAGKTMVSVMASNPRTLELLSQKASEIASILKEHTGEETVIYTEQPQKEPGEEAQERGGRGGQQQERQQHRQEEPSQTDSFMQQLRLGLV